MEVMNEIFAAITGIFDFLKGGEVAGILGMVSDILEYVKEFEAAGIVDIIAGFFATVSYLFYYKAINKIGAAKAMALNVTYVAWGIVFSIPVNMLLFATPLKDTLPTGIAVLCSAVVLVCGIFAAADFKDILGKQK